MLMGGSIVILGIFVMSSSMFSEGYPTDSYRYTANWFVWRELNRYQIGPIPFGIFSTLILLATNGLGLRNGLEWRQLLGTNILVVTLLVAIFFFLRPNLFQHW